MPTAFIITVYSVYNVVLNGLILMIMCSHTLHTTIAYTLYVHYIHSIYSIGCSSPVLDLSLHVPVPTLGDNPYYRRQQSMYIIIYSNAFYILRVCVYALYCY